MPLVAKAPAAAPPPKAKQRAARMLDRRNMPGWPEMAPNPASIAWQRTGGLATTSRETLELMSEASGVQQARVGP